MGSFFYVKNSMLEVGILSEFSQNVYVKRLENLSGFRLDKFLID